MRPQPKIYPNVKPKMASTPSTNPSTNDSPSAFTIKRRQTLFNYTAAEARTYITAHRASSARKLIPDKHWDTVSGRMSDAGYDREAYEHVLLLHSKKQPAVPPRAGTENDAAPSKSSSEFYLFKLGNQPLCTASEIQTVANLPTVPKIFILAEDSEEGRYCRVDGATKAKLEDYLLSLDHPASPSLSIFDARFVRCSMAKKDLDDTSAYPTLGLDTTLPQHRPRTATQLYAPQQTDYPVYYFFYGTLTFPAKLAQVLDLDAGEVPTLHPASISGGIVKTWRRGWKRGGGAGYKALVNGSEDAVVQGYAYLVRTREMEDELRWYEGGGYEVVRCGIFLEDEGGRRVQGCTFRFVDTAALR